MLKLFQSLGNGIFKLEKLIIWVLSLFKVQKNQNLLPPSNVVPEVKIKQEEVEIKQQDHKTTNLQRLKIFDENNIDTSSTDNSKHNSEIVNAVISNNKNFLTEIQEINYDSYNSNEGKLIPSNLNNPELMPSNSNNPELMASNSDNPELMASNSVYNPVYDSIDLPLLSGGSKNNKNKELNKLPVKVPDVRQQRQNLNEKKSKTEPSRLILPIVSKHRYWERLLTSLPICTLLNLIIYALAYRLQLQFVLLSLLPQLAPQALFVSISLNSLIYLIDMAIYLSKLILLNEFNLKQAVKELLESNSINIALTAFILINGYILILNIAQADKLLLLTSIPYYCRDSFGKSIVYSYVVYMIHYLVSFILRLLIN